MDFLEQAADLLNTLLGRKSWEIVGSGEGLRSHPLEKSKKDETLRETDNKGTDTRDIIEPDDVADVLEEVIKSDTAALDAAIILLLDYRKGQVIKAVEAYKRVSNCSLKEEDFQVCLKRLLVEYLNDK